LAQRLGIDCAEHQLAPEAVAELIAGHCLVAVVLRQPPCQDGLDGCCALANKERTVDPSELG
jgi:hypothetical protein